MLCGHRLLLVWDNFESACTLPDPAGVMPPLDAAEQNRMRAFLHAVARDGQRRDPHQPDAEDWLADVRRLELRGLLPGEAAEMAEGERGFSG